MIVVFCGAMGMGKTTLIKERFISKSKRTKRVYALMSSDFLDVKRIRSNNNFKQFLREAVKEKDSLHIIDEAKTAIPRNEPEANSSEFEDNLIKWILNSRKVNNFVVVVFHSLRDVPVWFLMYTNYFIRFGTNDQIQHQLNRFQSYESICKSLKENPTISKFEYDEIKIR